MVNSSQRQGYCRCNAKATTTVTGSHAISKLFITNTELKTANLSWSDYTEATLDFLLHPAEQEMLAKRPGWCTQKFALYVRRALERQPSKFIYLICENTKKSKQLMYGTLVNKRINGTQCLVHKKSSLGMTHYVTLTFWKKRQQTV